MNKGFTLVELLIVIVIVATMVTLALPKYQNALERGRALEGLRNVQYVAEYVIAKHTATGEWPSDTDPSMTNLKGTDIIKRRFFELPHFVNNTAEDKQSVYIERNGDWSYRITAAIHKDGYIESITCGNVEDATTNNCAELDLTGNLMTRK